MRLLIEDGMLLKECALAFDGEAGVHVNPPTGWTPDCAPLSDEEYMQSMARKQAPCPGWIPVSPRTDGDVSAAYRELFVRLTGERGKSYFPPDGHYVFGNGKIERDGKREQ